MQPTICFIVLTAIVGIEGQLENFEPKKDDKSDAIVEVLDVGRCRNAVKDYCPCGWAMCVRSHGYLCTDKVTKCCPNNYDINCCGNCHFSCHRWGFRESECWYYCYTCAERCKAIKPATVDSLNDCTFKCVDCESRCYGIEPGGARSHCRLVCRCCSKDRPPKYKEYECQQCNKCWNRCLRICDDNEVFDCTLRCLVYGVHTAFCKGMLG
ncbi:hypothetical protein GPALN_011615 [Globodera pallida]|nr:hypothetical protein GPALN_011615 [Globodera pallida]